MPDTRSDRRETLRRLHRMSGQLRAIAEHLKPLTEDLDELIDALLPQAGPHDPFPAPPSGSLFSP